MTEENEKFVNRLKTFKTTEQTTESAVITKEIKNLVLESFPHAYKELIGRHEAEQDASYHNSDVTEPSSNAQKVINDAKLHLNNAVALIKNFLNSESGEDKANKLKNKLPEFQKDLKNDLFFSNKASSNNFDKNFSSDMEKIIDKHVELETMIEQRKNSGKGILRSIDDNTSSGLPDALKKYVNQSNGKELGA